ncbi:hypothetical protein COOONC_10808, partial [Cooperia oncophora]
LSSSELSFELTFCFQPVSSLDFVTFVANGDSNVRWWSHATALHAQLDPNAFRTNVTHRAVFRAHSSTDVFSRTRVYVARLLPADFHSLSTRKLKQPQTNVQGSDTFPVITKLLITYK